MPNLTSNLPALAAAFGKDRVSPQMINEYETGLSELSDSQCDSLFLWAKRECETFPKIKTLRDQAVNRGWIVKPQVEEKDDWVTIECKCTGTFVVSERELRADPTRVHYCPNRKLWGCNRSFEAGMILGNMDDKKFVSLHPDWRAIFPQFHSRGLEDGTF